MFESLYKFISCDDDDDSNDESLVRANTRRAFGAIASSVDSDPNRVILLGGNKTPRELSEFGTLVLGQPADTDLHETQLLKFLKERNIAPEEFRAVLLCLSRDKVLVEPEDSASCKLSKWIAHPAAMFGNRVADITPGPGMHNPVTLMSHYASKPSLQVPAGEIWITIDSTGILTGDVATYKLREAPEGLQVFDRVRYIGT